LETIALPKAVAIQEVVREWILYTTRKPDKSGHVVIAMAARERRKLARESRLIFSTAGTLQTRVADEDGLHHKAFHDREWRPLDWYLKTPNQPELYPRPKRYEEIVALAECLGKGFDHLRVDISEAA
jgi:hypothetical protein